ncbi:MAG: tripartite tricarboxylate transporter substrate binding protein [Halomonas sp.]|nr:tripartite tricarboxylate transporter substrate binding protein [Halomonas sp.]
MKMKLAVSLGAPLVLALTGAAQAQDFPDKNIQIIVPGYTLGVFGYPDNFVLEHTRDTDFSFDSLEYLAAFDEMPMGIFASPNSSITNLDELISFGQENPGELVVGESGALGLLHALALAERSEMEVSPVRYSGGGELMNALLGNHIELASTSSMSHDPIVDSDGKPIGFAAEERMDMFPDVPTFKEQGLDLVMGVSRVLVAPAGLPDDVRDAITSALDEISNDEEMIANFENSAIPYRYLNDNDVNDMLEQSNEVLMPVIESNLDKIDDN